MPASERKFRESMRRGDEEMGAHALRWCVPIAELLFGASRLGDKLCGKDVLDPLIEMQVL